MEFKEVLNSVLYIILSTVLPILAGFAIAAAREWLSTKKLNKYIKLAADAVVSAVECTNQTFVDELKKAGKFDKKAAHAAFEMTKSTVLTLLTDEAKSIINTAYSDFDMWLNAKIEEVTRSNKTYIFSSTSEGGV